MAAAIISIEEAVAHGLTRFFTGVPCPRGHVAERRVLGRHCTECHRVNAKRYRDSLTEGRASEATSQGITESGTVHLVNGWPARDALSSFFVIESRKQAILAGRKRFFTGDPCGHGHIDQRSAVNGGCIACVLKQRTGSDERRKQLLLHAIGGAVEFPPSLPEWPRITRDEARARGEKRYFEGKTCKAGHVAPRYVGNHECIICSRVKNQERYATDPEYRMRRIAYETERNRRPDVRIKRLVKMSEYSQRPEVRKRLLERIKHDPQFKLEWTIRTQLRAALKKCNHKKRTRLQAILGCTITDFKRHMQRQFDAGMTWGNHCEWEIDHIVSLNTAKNGEDVIALFHHTNLRPLWKKDNREKGSRALYLI